ncbi:MAG TPA: hypothetical protein PKE69_26945, partial [Pyrinomonadaceae bacterium]|nr:hypothetical protein [Pyrinomonadaceae bacterium]
LDIQIMLLRWFRLQYPNALYNAAQILSSIPLERAKYAGKMKAAGNTSGWPDIFFAEPRGGFHGLFIELKSDTAKVFLKKTGAPATDHIAEQLAVLERLRARGYKAEMCIGFDAAQKVIDDYFNL